ncbi:MAG: hypothetical protein ACOYD0_09145 [Candidatus Nanopelagicales bacterium]
MYLHLALPDRTQIDQLMLERRPGSVTIYLATEEIGDNQAPRLALANLWRVARGQLEAAGHDKQELLTMDEVLDDLDGDEDFWAHQARSLALFLTPDTVATFQLPNHLADSVHVSDRFHLKPLLRSLTFTKAAYVLAISQNQARVLEVFPEGDPQLVNVPDMPDSAVDAVGVSSISGRTQHGRVQGSEGQKMRLGQYSRAVDQALRPLLVGRDVLLVLAATSPLDSIYRQWNTYPNLADATLPGNPDNESPGDLADRAREVLDQAQAAELSEVREIFESRVKQGRAKTDVADVARAATFGMVETLFVDIDAALPGTIDESTGFVTFADGEDAQSYGIVDEIARRTWLAGGEVLAVRREDVPGSGEIAAILRWSPENG